MKLRKAINEFLSWKATYTSKAPGTYKLYLDRFHDFTKKNVEDIELQDIVGYRMAIKRRGLSDNSVMQHLIVVKNFIRFYREQGIGKVSPSQIVIPKNFVVNSYEPVTPEDFEKMCSVLDEDHFQDLQKLCCIHLLWYTGIRVTELCELNVAKLSKSETVIKNLKNPDFRLISWPVQTARLLDKYIKIKSKLNLHPALFCGNSPNSRDRITSRAVQRWLNEICERAGTRQYSPHCFRNGKSHNMRSHGADDTAIATVLGHRNIQSTRSYLRLNEKESRKLLKKYLK